MSITDSLAKDHRTLEQLLTQLAETRAEEAPARIARFSRLQALLQAHSRAEEEVVYRRLMRWSSDEEKTLEAFEEHHVADVLLQELASACPGGVAWSAKLKVLEELLRHHIKEEELILFPLIQDCFNAENQDRMAREFEWLKHEEFEELLAPLRRATPAFAGRASITLQAAMGRYLRRGELFLRDRISGQR